MVANVVNAQRIEGSQKSWHGLETTMTLEQAQDLNHVIKDLPNPVSRQLVYIGEDGTPKPSGHIAIVDGEGESENVLGVHTDSYCIHSPAEVLAPYHDAILSDGRMHWDFVATLKGGRVFTAVAVLEEMPEIVSEAHKGYLFATSSFDGSLNTHLGATAVRIVCENTLRAAFQAKDTKRLKFKHRSPLPGMSDIQRQIEQALGQIDAYKAFAEMLALHRMSKDVAIDFLRKSIFTPELKEVKDSTGKPVKVWTEPGTRASNRIEALIKSFEVSNDEIGSDVSAWNVFNGITRYADHESGVRMTEGRKEKGESAEIIRLESNIFGNSDKFKQENVKRLIELVAA